ncbi:hypothetical protein D3C73_1323960 [compost metagenome]
MLFAIQVNPNPAATATIAPIAICISFTVIASVRVNTAVLLTARTRIAALARLAIHKG